MTWDLLSAIVRKYSTIDGSLQQDGEAINCAQLSALRATTRNITSLEVKQQYLASLSPFLSSPVVWVVGIYQRSETAPGSMQKVDQEAYEAQINSASLNIFVCRGLFRNVTCYLCPYTTKVVLKSQQTTTLSLFLPPYRPDGPCFGPHIWITQAAGNCV